MGVTIREHVELAPYTTLGVGGPARFFVTATTREELTAAIAYAHTQELRIAILGGGSNCLVADKGFDGLVIEVAISGIEYDKNEVRVGAGVEWDTFVSDVIAQGYAGVEHLSGIPGTVGGAVVQNIGAYGVELSDVCVNINVYDIEQGVYTTIAATDAQFAYRTSIFKNNNRFVVLQTVLNLKRTDSSTGTYAGLPETATVMEMRDAVLEQRKAKGMLAGQHRSAGSYFTNPVITIDALERIVEHYKDVPSYPVDNAHVKVPAAWLIEHAGFSKGLRNETQTVGLSPQHALAIVTYNDARAADVVTFAETIKDAVRTTFGVTLTNEVTYIT